MRYLITNLIVIVFFLSSCKKENNSLVSSGDKITLSVSVSGIKDLESSTPKQASLINNYNSQFIEESASSTISLGQVALEISSETQSMATYESEATKNKFQNQKLGSTFSSIKGGITYRLLLYNTTTQRMEQSVLVTVGTNPTSIAVVNGQEYRYYAYSYNNSEQIADPALSNYIIDTPTDKALVYTSGTITPTANNQSLGLTFEHKLAQVVVEVDYDRLFGSVTNINATFGSDSYLNKGKFSIVSGEVSDITTYTAPSPIVFTEDDTENQVKTARYYVADPSALTSFTVNVNELSVKYINNSNVTLITSTRPVVFGSSANPYVPAIGKQLIGKIKLWKYFTAKKILHFTTNTTQGYAADVAASYNMIHEKLNYGDDARSLCKFSPGTTNAFISTVIRTNNKIKNSIEDYDPDIIILAAYYNYGVDDRTALLEFVRAGGVLINFPDDVSFSTNGNQDFLRLLFDDDNINLVLPSHSPGYVFPFLDINDEILNGAFGDVRGKYWGEDGSSCIFVENIPTNDITIYGSTVSLNGNTYNGINMFKHNKYHFFFIGNAGFLSGPNPNGYSTFVGGTVVVPFSTVRTEPTLGYIHQLLNPNPLFNYDNFPYPKSNYGGGNIGGAIYTIFNSTFFANIMSWAVVNAEFFGANTGGLPSTPVNP